jgi:hypothetical protein
MKKNMLAFMKMVLVKMAIQDGGHQSFPKFLSLPSKREKYS